MRQSACASLGVTGLVNTLAHLTLTRAALAQTPDIGTDYKALVVLFLYGGNDSNNMLIPRMGHAGYADYKQHRGVLGVLDSSDPAYVNGNPASVPLTGGGATYGVHPSLQPLAGLFNSGKLAFVANVGTLAYPLNRAEFLAGTVAAPPQLFSHSSQQVQWQSSLPDKPFQSGWGGRVADLLLSEGQSNGDVSLSISLAGLNSLQVGNEVVQYAVTPSGTVSLAGYSSGNDPYGGARSGSGYQNNNAGRRLKAFDEITNYTHQNLHEEEYAKVLRRARDTEAVVSAAFTAAAAGGVNIDSHFTNANTSLGNQLKTIAKLIAGRNGLGNRRQIFFCSVGGYDTHASQLAAHGPLMQELGNALKAFSDATAALGVDDKVVTLTHSDFTRTLTPNKSDAASAGSDHGWGGHHIVMGGPVTGNQIYGHFPELRVSDGLDAGTSRGRWIPTTAVDQYAAVAARWLGVNGNALDSVFPNLSRFEDPFSTSANLGFLPVV